MSFGDVRTVVPTNGGDMVSKFGVTWKSQVEQLKAKFGSKIEEVRMPGDYATDVPIVYVKADAIVEVLTFVKNDPSLGYNFLSDITATDEEIEPRFEVVYNLLSHANFSRIRFKVRANEGQEVPTATSVWQGADWAEREVWDMFGIKFKGHPDLRRILMDARWQGHPLRKDYPLRGYQIFTEPMDIEQDSLK